MCVMSDTLPAGLSMAQGAVDFVYDASAGELTWDIPELTPGAGLKSVLQLQAGDSSVGTVITNTVIATGRDLDGAPRIPR